MAVSVNCITSMCNVQWLQRSVAVQTLSHLPLGFPQCLKHPQEHWHYKMDILSYRGEMGSRWPRQPTFPTQPDSGSEMMLAGTGRRTLCHSSPWAWPWLNRMWEISLSLFYRWEAKNKRRSIYIQPLYVYGYQYTDKTFLALKNIMPLAYHEKEQLEAKLCRDDDALKVLRTRSALKHSENVPEEGKRELGLRRWTQFRWLERKRRAFRQMKQTKTKLRGINEHNRHGNC